MCESHVYRHKTLISLIKDNVWICESGVRNYFSPLTHKSRQIVLQHMIYSENSIHFPLKYSKKALKDDIIRKSKHAKVVIFWSFGSAQRLSEHLWMFLATFGSLQKIIGHCWRVFVNPGYDKAKISLIWLRKSWQVIICKVQTLVDQAWNSINWMILLLFCYMLALWSNCHGGVY